MPPQGMNWSTRTVEQPDGADDQQDHHHHAERRRPAARRRRRGPRSAPARWSCPGRCRQRRRCVGRLGRPVAAGDLGRGADRVGVGAGRPARRLAVPGRQDRGRGRLPAGTGGWGGAAGPRRDRRSRRVSVGRARHAGIVQALRASGRRERCRCVGRGGEEPARPPVVVGLEDQHLDRLAGQAGPCRQAQGAQVAVGGADGRPRTRTGPAPRRGRASRWRPVRPPRRRGRRWTGPATAGRVERRGGR